MRKMFLIMMMVMIGVGGYVSAAHADAGACDAQTTQTDCPDHQDEGVSSLQDGPDAGEKSSNLCVDCHHCCAFHADGVLSYAVHPPLPSDAMDPLLTDGHMRHSVISLLRPPKSLI